MAITPLGARQAYTVANASNISNAVRKIDEFLHNHPDGGQMSAEHIPWQLADQIMNEYRNAGWSVRRTDDQRDGTYYDFRPRRSGSVDPY